MSNQQTIVKWPTEKCKKDMFDFFKQTSIPRLIKEHQEKAQQKKSI